MIALLGMLLDAALGEPRWLWSRLPHPAVMMGRVIGWMDLRWNRGRNRKAKGVAALCALILGAGLLGVVMTLLFGAWGQVLVLAVLLAQRSLSDHVREVAHAMARSLPEGRQAVARIVGRDTAQMDGPAVARSAIESAAENLSDGVTAPLFWFVVGGLPGLLIYKATNTADSMIGYQTPRHADFGWAAARFDDLMNLVPARLTAALMLLVTGRLDVATRVRTEAPLHRSPNAGWPEAALAHALGFALSGPRSYDGAMRDYPFVNKAGLHALGPDQIAAAVRLLWKTWAALLVLVAIVAIF